MCVSKNIPTTPASPADDYASPPPASSTQPRRQTGTTTSTIAIPPPHSFRYHQNHRSRRRSRRAKSLRARRRNFAPSSADDDQRRGTTTTGKRDGWIEKGVDEQKGSDEAADTTQGVPPPWWRTDNRKRGCKFDFLSLLHISISCRPPLAFCDFFDFLFCWGRSRRGDEWWMNGS